MKLTRRQKEVVKDLQSGYVLCTNSSMSGAMVGNSNGQYRINSRVFWGLVDLELIFQNCNKNSDCGYELTKSGKEIVL